MTKISKEKMLRQIIDEGSMEAQAALSIGMMVRNADGWIGEITAIHPVHIRNPMGHIGLVSVKKIDNSINRFAPKRFKVGEIIVTPAANFKPLSSGLIFSRGEWIKE